MKKVLIIGAGPVGCTIANKLSSKYKIDIFDRRKHIAGNCYDYKDKYGVLVHKYGPHYFRTNSKQVIKYLSNFTEWIDGDYKVNSFVDGKLFQFPINLNTLEKFFNKKFTKNTARKFLEEISIKSNNNNFEDYLKSKLGKLIYEKFYKNYTAKQWNKNPKKLDASIAKRIPIRFNRDNKYIRAKYTVMPKKGFTYMFNKMIKKKNINLNLGKKYNSQFSNLKKYDIVIYTGPIDNFFNFKYGRLNWRSLRFKFNSYKKKFHQKVLQINYPNNYKFTRKVEYKHVTKQRTKFTTISSEYPKNQGQPYYPVNLKRDKSIYKKYKLEAKKLEKKNIFCCGRLAEYTYINTDEAVLRGLNLAKIILKKK